MMPAKVLGPSEGGADSRTITYERSGTVVTHDCAPFSTAVHCPYANNPTTHLSSLGPQPVREKAACQNSLPQGLEPPVTPPAKPAPNAAKPRAKPSANSAAKPAAKVAAKLAAQPAAGEPIPVAPVEHVQLFKSNTPARKSDTQSQFLSRAEHASQRTVPGSFVVHMPS
eukprot:CAMPEP_0174377884 /NCGR_PEP_ID=MMETSP0811_2-20130205/121715_1 /TAXON_ID=73025 ORGANISM="Eutreptiella gymnastica-like, Strain CCMP1594" /NCGR_SAMPLE_ID=MMETSP0811_2 /ASSEMBLY_ACC=CAM_ASM_000667 /LENGTH=168 /DNA_ID=CAMNT_0015529983 /DNA_START=639 /DNA_END=1144 /DNA_ORIENTATION=+